MNNLEDKIIRRVISQIKILQEIKSKEEIVRIINYEIDNAEVSKFLH